MTNKEYIENLCTFINHFKDEIEHDGYGDKIFDTKQAQKDIETFEAAIRALEFYDKAEVVISQLRADRDKLAATLDSSERPSMWINVNDFLPEERENPITMDYYQYPVTYQNGDVTDIRYYGFGKGHWWHGSEIMDKYVIAWMPLPELYKGNRKN